MLASGSNDNTAKLWDLGTGRELRTVNGHTKSVSSVAFSADGKTLATGSWDKTVKLWDVSSGRELRTLIGHSDLVDAVAFTGNFLLTGSADATMKLWRIDSNKPLATLISLDKGDWVVVTPDNRFDTGRNLDNIEGLHWVMPDAPFTPLPLGKFMRDYYEPRLLARLMKCSEENNCDREFKAAYSQPPVKPARRSPLSM
jgi:WD40 repeat protein